MSRYLEIVTGNIIQTEFRDDEFENEWWIMEGNWK